jgi:hypothetical protein
MDEGITTRILVIILKKNLPESTQLNVSTYLEKF